MADEPQRPQRRVIYDKVIEGTITSVVAALVLGFFVVLWTDRSDIKDKLVQLTLQAKQAEIAVQAATETLAREVAKLHASEMDGRVTQLEQIVKVQNDELIKLRNYCGKNPSERGAPPEISSTRLNVPVSNQASKVFEEEDRIRNDISRKRSILPRKDE